MSKIPNMGCQALFMDGSRCKKRATNKIQYLGNYEIYDSSSDKPNWVVVYLCDKHAEVRS